MSASGSGQGLHALVLTPFYPSLGDDATGCFVAEPLAWLNEVEVRSTVISVQPFYKGLRQSNPRFPSLSQKFFSLPGGWGLSSAGAFLFSSLLPIVRRLHRQNRIDVIHAHAALPCGHAASLLSRTLKIPFVVTVHGLDAFSTNQVRGVPGAWCERVSRLVYRSACAVICISEKVRERLTQGSQQFNAGVIYNGVDPEKFRPDSQPEKATILSVGNLIPIKGQDLLLQAFASVAKDHPTLELDVIGDGPERTNLANLADSLGVGKRINFRGRQPRAEVAAAMRASTIFALPSRYEGLGCVYLEAMSSGLPTIACRGQGIDEVIQHGKNGWLTEPGSVAELSEALSRLLQDGDLRRQMGEAARRTVLSEFTLQHHAAQLSALYRECMG